MNTELAFCVLLVFVPLYVVGSITVYYYLKIKCEYMYNKWSQQCRVSNLLKMQCLRNVTTCKRFCLRSDLNNCDYYLETKQMEQVVDLEDTCRVLLYKKSFDISKGAYEGNKHMREDD